MVEESPKKLRERAAVETFKKLLPAFPDGQIVSGEEPDFTVGDLGIEVIEYFRPDNVAGSPLQEQEALRHRITTAATNGCKLANANVFVTAFFNRSERIRKKDVETVATAIVSVAVAFAASAGVQQTINNVGQLPACIDTLVLAGPVGEPFATSTDAVWVSEITSDELRTMVIGKEERLSAYRRRCSKVWLLIVVNGFRLSSIAQLPRRLPFVASGFDGVYVLHDSRRVVSLN